MTPPKKNVHSLSYIVTLQNSNIRFEKMNCSICHSLKVLLLLLLFNWITINKVMKIFMIEFQMYIVPTPILSPVPTTHSWRGSGGPEMVLGSEPGSALCKMSIVTPILALWPQVSILRQSLAEHKHYSLWWKKLMEVWNWCFALLNNSFPQRLDQFMNLKVVILSACLQTQQHLVLSDTFKSNLMQGAGGWATDSK